MLELSEPVVVYTGPDGKPRSAYESHRAQWVATGDRMWLDRMVAAMVPRTAHCNGGAP